MCGDFAFVRNFALRLAARAQSRLDSASTIISRIEGVIEASYP